MAACPCICVCLCVHKCVSRLTELLPCETAAPARPRGRCGDRPGAWPQGQVTPGPLASRGGQGAGCWSLVFGRFLGWRSPTPGPLLWVQSAAQAAELGPSLGWRLLSV